MDPLSAAGMLAILGSGQVAVGAAATASMHASRLLTVLTSASPVTCAAPGSPVRRRHMAGAHRRYCSRARGRNAGHEARGRESVCVCVHAGTWGGYPVCWQCSEPTAKTSTCLNPAARDQRSEPCGQQQRHRGPAHRSEPRCEQAIPGRVCGARGSEPARARALTAGMTVQAAAGAGPSAPSAQASSTPAPAARHDFPRPWMPKDAATGRGILLLQARPGGSCGSRCAFLESLFTKF